MNKCLNVLSLFDGISCAQIALKNNKMNVSKYYASEIERHAIAVTQKNFPHTVQLGDVKNISKELLLSLGKIDIIFAGFPCQDISSAGKKAGLSGERSGLFFEFLRVLKIIQEINSNVYFLVENVGGISKSDLLIINNELNVESIYLDSASFSPQRRKRHYWTNIKVKNPDITNHLVLNDILETNPCLESTALKPELIEIYKLLKEDQYWKDLPIDHIERLKINVIRSRHKNPGGLTGFWRVYDKNKKSPTILSQGLKQRMTRFVILTNNIYRYPTPIEYERLQGLPDNYTDNISIANRYKAVGNGWNVPTIQYILKGLL